MTSFKLFYSLLFFICICFLGYSQQNDLLVNGTIVDESNYGIPYVAIGIPSKYVGTSSNEEGAFSMNLSKSNLSDTLEVSSIGYKTIKITVQDYINQKEKTIVLLEDIVSLDAVNILKTTDYIKLAVKSLKKTTVSNRHQLNVLYRRFSSENYKARFLAEQYVKVLDNGPINTEFTDIEVAEGRKSADYRFAKKKQTYHAINVVAQRDPLRQGNILKDYTWKKIGDTRYDGEDLVILQGVGKKQKWKKVKLYIGVDNFAIYKVETTDLDAIYIYKKHFDGRLYLSYHSRVWSSNMPLNPIYQKALGLKKDKVAVSYKHEAIVLGIETNKKKIKVSSFGRYGKDMGDLDVKYNATFWKNLSMPPESDFYKKSVKELESIYGVPLETQFELVNK
ncbi:carboxypeptidase-like regulatory domain-containing protein [Postechiella marina]|uniref:carboxypeptidase-like regulatory domain-containing protein n=1 Tax=Postechiella marina TaxID=943941 RepID=UPI0031CDD21F